MQNILNVKTHAKRIFVLLLLICFAALSLLSEIFILTHGDHLHEHNCAGSRCTTCIQLKNTENILKNLGISFALISFAVAFIFSAENVMYYVFSVIESYTPVSLKIRMNN